MDWNGRNGCDALNCTVCRRGTFFNRNWNFPPHEKVRGLNYRRPGHYQSINLYHCITLYMLLLGMTYKRSEKGADNTGLSCFHVMQHWSIILHIPYKVLQSTCYSEFGVRSRQGLQDYEYSVPIVPGTRVVHNLLCGTVPGTINITYLYIVQYLFRKSECNPDCNLTIHLCIPVSRLQWSWCYQV